MRLSGTKTGAINQYRGLGNQLWDLAGNRPSLDLPFADNKSLVDATTGANLVDFTRASSGTYVDSEGVIRTATTNLLLRSEEFDQSPWGTIRSIITSNAVTSPNGSVTADKFIASTDPSTSHYVRQSVSLSAFQVYNFTVYAKAAEYGYLSITTFGSNGWSATTTSYFDLVNGVVTPSTTGIASIADVGNGWYRINHQATKGDTSGSSNIDIYVANSGSSVSFTGDGTSGIYLWGAQLEQSTTVGEYIPTTSTINSAPRFNHNPTTGESLGLLVEEQRTNLVLQSEDFSTTWSIDGEASIATNTIASPTSTLTADTLTVSAGGANRVSQSYSVPSAGTYTLSVYAKAGTGNLLQLRQFLSGNDAYVVFNFTTGVMSDVSGGTSASATATALPNWWYRLVLTNTYSGAATINIRIGGAVGSSETNTTFYLWGAQLEAGSFPTSYIPTTTAAATRAADVASISGSNFGVSRTNLLLRSEEFDNTSVWGDSAGTTTRNANTEIAPNGTLTADELVFAAADNLVQQSITVVSGVSYAASIWIKGTAGQTIRFTANNIPGGSNVTLTGDWVRYSFVGVSTGTSATLNISTFGGVTARNIYIWGAQLETGTTATAYIPTTTAAVTVVDSSWYRQDEGTVFADANGLGSNVPSGDFQTLASFSDGTNDTRIELAYMTSSVASWILRVSGSASVTLNPSISSIRRKLAGSFDSSIAQVSANGSTVLTDGSVIIPTVNKLDIGGSNASPVKDFYGHIRRLTYWPARLPNETLQTITQ